MPTFSNWYQANDLDVLSASERAVRCWMRIQDRASSIVIDRDGSTLSAQTVRIEYGEQADPHRSDVAGAGVRDVWVIGVANHPSVADTNIRARDRFALNYETYVVVDVISVPGEVQARCERLS